MRRNVVNINYIPSKYSYDQVIKILNEENEKSTAKWSNPAYAVLRGTAYVIRYGTFLCMIYIFWQFFFKHKTYILPLIDIVDKIKNADGMEMISSVFFYIVIYFVFWYLSIKIFQKFLMFCVKKLFCICCENGIIIPDKYKATKVEIKRVYKDIENFLDYINTNPELKETDFFMDESKTILLRKIHHLDKDQTIRFYLGPHLKDIIINHNTLDFSELDKIYELV